jgi:hypothetical protein
MPPPLRHAPLNSQAECLWSGRLLALVPPFIAKPASCGDVTFLVFPTILTGKQVLSRALKCLGLSCSDLVSCSELLGRVLPHGAVAVDAATLLALECGGADGGDTVHGRDGLLLIKEVRHALNA